MRARDQCSIYSTSGKFHIDYMLLLEVHALTQVARSYALLIDIVTHRADLSQPCTPTERSKNVTLLLLTGQEYTRMFPCLSTMHC